jgi:hypothetical protein
MRQYLLSLAALVLLPLGAALAAPQDAAEAPPTKDEQTAEYLASIKKQVGKQQEMPAKATATKLAEIWNDAEISEGTKKDVPALMEKIALSKADMPAVAGIEGLAAIKNDAAAKSLTKVLAKTLKAKEASVQVYSACFKALGTTASEDSKVVKDLTKLLKYKNYDVVGKAAQALAGYKDASGKLRKELLEEVIKNSEGVYNAAQNNDQNMKRKWNIIQSGIMKALKALSGQSFKNPGEARSWYNDNKKNRDIWK